MALEQTHANTQIQHFLHLAKSWSFTVDPYLKAPTGGNMHSLSSQLNALRTFEKRNDLHLDAATSGESSPCISDSEKNSRSQMPTLDDVCELLTDELALEIEESFDKLKDNYKEGIVLLFENLDHSFRTQRFFGLLKQVTVNHYSFDRILGIKDSRTIVFRDSTSMVVELYTKKPELVYDYIIKCEAFLRKEMGRPIKINRVVGDKRRKGQFYVAIIRNLPPKVTKKEIITQCQKEANGNLIAGTLLKVKTRYCCMIRFENLEDAEVVCKRLNNFVLKDPQTYEKYVIKAHMHPKCSSRYGRIEANPIPEPPKMDYPDSGKTSAKENKTGISELRDIFAKSKKNSISDKPQDSDRRSRFEMNGENGENGSHPEPPELNGSFPSNENRMEFEQQPSSRAMEEEVYKSNKFEDNPPKRNYHNYPVPLTITRDNGGTSSKRERSERRSSSQSSSRRNNKKNSPQKYQREDNRYSSYNKRSEHQSSNRNWDDKKKYNRREKDRSKSKSKSPEKRSKSKSKESKSKSKSKSRSRSRSKSKSPSRRHQRHHDKKRRNKYEEDSKKRSKSRSKHRDRDRDRKKHNRRSPSRSDSPRPNKRDEKGKESPEKKKVITIERAKESSSQVQAENEKQHSRSPSRRSRTKNQSRSRSKDRERKKFYTAHYKKDTYNNNNNNNEHRITRDYDSKHHHRHHHNNQSYHSDRHGGGYHKNQRDYDDRRKKDRDRDYDKDKDKDRRRNRRSRSRSKSSRSRKSSKSRSKSNGYDSRKRRSSVEKGSAHHADNIEMKREG